VQQIIHQSGAAKAEEQVVQGIAAGDLRGERAARRSGLHLRQQALEFALMEREVRVPQTRLLRSLPLNLQAA
jgi:hypothetical protein